MNLCHALWTNPKIVSEYGQEIPQSQTADNPMAPRVRAAQPSRDTSPKGGLQYQRNLLDLAET